MRAALWLGSLLAAATVLAPATLRAQPMMMDPSRMSGIPRPDPQVPAGTITVRLIRGELSNRMVGVAVQLSDANGKVTSAKTDAEGRATFSGLPVNASYQARAQEGDEQLTTQQIDLPADMGVRVMLVFKPSAGVAGADGVARPDKTIPANTVIVRALGEGGAPAAGLDVTLGMARKGEEGVKSYKAKTNGDGEARFEGLGSKPTSGYMAEVVSDGTHYPSKPFRLQENAGSRVILDVRPVSKDVAQLRISAEHLILEPIEDAVQVLMLVRLTNPTKAAIDPGAAGVHIPLPDKALQGQAGPQSTLSVKVLGHDAIVTGSIPPGDSELQLIYALAYDGDALVFHQTSPLPIDELGVVHEKKEPLTVDAPGANAEDRTMGEGEQRRSFVLYSGIKVPAGGAIQFTFRGLPHSDPTWRLLAAIVTIALILGFSIYAASAKSPRSERDRLEAERETLLAQLVTVEQAGGSDDKRARKKEQLMAQLTRVYRDLDEVR